MKARAENESDERWTLRRARPRLTERPGFAVSPADFAGYEALALVVVDDYHHDGALHKSRLDAVSIATTEWHRSTKS